MKGIRTSAVLLAALLSALSGVSHAAPVYLACTTQSEGDPEQVKFSVSLDESTRKVTHTNANGYAFNADGFFTANTVSYKRVNAGPVTTSEQYEIDRTTLAVVSTSKIEITDPLLRGKEPPAIFNYRGTCSIIDNAERKF